LETWKINVAEEQPPPYARIRPARGKCDYSGHSFFGVSRTTLNRLAYAGFVAFDSPKGVAIRQPI
jgi:hypothetical protein